jgi:hypothetical protein
MMGGSGGEGRERVSSGADGGGGERPRGRPRQGPAAAGRRAPARSRVHPPAARALTQKGRTNARSARSKRDAREHSSRHANRGEEN